MSSNVDMEMMELKIKKLIKASGMRIGDFEEKLGISKGYISRIAKKSPSFELIWSIAEELGVSIETLAKGTDEESVANSDSEMINNKETLPDIITNLSKVTQIDISGDIKIRFNFSQDCTKKNKQ